MPRVVLEEQNVNGELFEVVTVSRIDVLSRVKDVNVFTLSSKESTAHQCHCLTIEIFKMHWMPLIN